MKHVTIMHERRPSASMRRIMTFNNVSADGRFSATDGTLDWTVPDPEMSAHVMRGSGERGTAIFGRRTFEMFEAVWPKVLADPHAPPMMLTFARSLDAMDKIVFSRTRKTSLWRNTRFIDELTRGSVEGIKRDAASDIIIFGSGSIVERLTDLGLIDEYTFVVNPVILGRGRALLHDANLPTDLSLVEATPFKSGNVVLRYARKGPMAARRHM